VVAVEQLLSTCKLTSYIPSKYIIHQRIHKWLS